MNINDIDFTTIVKDFLIEHGFLFETVNEQVLRSTCPKCRMSELLIYAEKGTWRCLKCRIAGNFLHMQKLFLKQVTIPAPLIRARYKKMIRLNSDTSMNISQDQLKSIVETAHLTLISNTVIKSTIFDYFGINDYSVGKYELGWADENFKVSGIRYYHRRLIVPVKNSAGAISSLRFHAIPGITQTSLGSPILNLRDSIPSAFFVVNKAADARNLIIVENEISGMALLADQATRLLDDCNIVCPLWKMNREFLFQQLKSTKKLVVITRATSLLNRIARNLNRSSRKKTTIVDCSNNYAAVFSIVKEVISK